MLFLKSGILTTIQDLGRSGHRSSGINLSGAMDKYVVRLLNILLENDENEGIIEMHFPAAEILFEEDCTVASNILVSINESVVESFKRINLKVGDVLKFPKKSGISRVYLVIKGGIEAENWLDSVSTNLIVGVGQKIEKGDSLKCKNPLVLPISKFSISPSLLPKYSQNPIIRIIAGNEYKFLDDSSKRSLENQQFTISNDSNRMGYRLKSETLSLTPPSGAGGLSSAVDFGTIQLLPSGQLIVLMADHQTTGGYPRIGHVASVDLGILAQLGAGDSFRFQIISIEQAQELLFLRENELKKLKGGIKLGER